MGKRGQKSGLTLIEMLAVLAIIMLLVGMLAGVAARITTQGKERLTRDTISLIGNALEQFRDFDYKYKDPGFDGLVFPLDCNGFSPFEIETTLTFALAATSVGVGGGTHDPNFSGSEVLYFFLNQVPSSRVTIDKVDKTLVTNKDQFGNKLTLTVTTTGATVYPLLRFIDPWGTALHYDYYDEVSLDPETKKTFPVITSAGPDRRFGTNDDISNIQAK